MDRRGTRQLLFGKQTGSRQAHQSFPSQARLWQPFTLPDHCFDYSPPMQQGFNVLLDGRVLRTPARHELVLPNKGLALAIAAEWQWQVSGTAAARTIRLPAAKRPL